MLTLNAKARDGRPLLVIEIYLLLAGVGEARGRYSLPWLPNADLLQGLYVPVILRRHKLTGQR